MTANETLLDEIVGKVASRLKVITGAVWIAIALMALVGIPYVLMPPLRNILFGGGTDMPVLLAHLPLTPFARSAILIVICSFVVAAFVSAVGRVASFIPSFERPVPLSAINSLSEDDRVTLAAYLQDAATDIGGTLGSFAKASLEMNSFRYRIRQLPVFVALLILSGTYALFAG